jgi:hypothetical protein
MTHKVIFTEFALAGLRMALGADPRFDAIKRSVEDRALYMIERVGRRCPAFPNREMYVDHPAAGSIELRVLVEVTREQRIVWSIGTPPPETD